MFLRKSFKFMGRTMRVTERALFTPNDADMGASCISEGEIVLNADMPEDVKDETIMHELMEAIKAANDLEVCHKDLSVLSNCLFAVLRDNGILK